MKNLYSRAMLQKGITLIELIVAMAIGMIVVLAATSLLTIGESHKRTTTSKNDMGQSGAYASHILDRAVRSAGSGFAQSWDLGIFGCKLNVVRAGTQILPRTSAFPSPFTDFLDGIAGAANLRVAPVIIGKGQSSADSDVLMLMTGNAAAGDIARPIRTPGALAANELRLDNTIGFMQGDLVLISRPGTVDCLIEQVSTPSVTTPEVLSLAGNYYTSIDPYSTMRASSMVSPAYLTAIGNVNANNVQFQLFGVGDNQTLYSYDLLRSGTTGTDTESTLAIAEGVLAMRALYGVDTTGDGRLDAWVDPATAGYDPVTVMTTPATAKKIMAVRIALVMRGTNYEKTAVSPASRVLFSDLPAAVQQTLTFTSDEQHYRYNVIEATIPLRNMLLLPI